MFHKQQITSPRSLGLKQGRTRHAMNNRLFRSPNHHRSYKDDSYSSSIVSLVGSVYLHTAAPPNCHVGFVGEPASELRGTHNLLRFSNQAGVCSCQQAVEHVT
jgi:hypothetical protein